MSAAEQAIPNKVATIRPAEHPWITYHIRSLIRKRKRIYKKFKRTANANLREKYKIIRNKIVSLIRNSRNDYFENLDSLLSTETTDMKLLWKTSKQLLKLGKSTSIMPTLNSNDERAESDIEKATLLNMYFAAQSTAVDDNRPIPQLLHAEHSLQTITISSQEVKDVLLNLSVNKACGPDLISPRFLKEGAVTLSSPFSNSVQSFSWTGLLPLFLETWTCNNYSQERW